MFAFLLFPAWISKILLWTKGEAHGSESEESEGWRVNNSDGDHEGKLLEEGEVSEEQEHTTSEGCDGSTQDTYSHLSVCLSHFEESCFFLGVDVISCQVHNVVHWETDECDNWNWLWNTKLLFVDMKSSNNTAIDNCNAEDGD